MFELKKEILESCEALLTVNVEEQAVHETLRKAARKISRQVNIPGFRKGKAPYNVLVRMVGEDAIRQETAEMLLEQLYPQVVEQAEIEPYAPGEVEDLSLSPMVFTIRVPLMPEIDLGAYESLRKAFEEVVVTEEELAEELEYIRQENAVLDWVERPAQLGDMVILEVLNGDFDDETVIHDHDVEVVLDAEKPFIAPGFVTALVGLREEETKTFSVTLPDDFSEEPLQGQEVEFEVEVAKVYARTLPDLDDALASVAGNFETLDALQADLRRRMQDYKEHAAREAYRDELVTMLMDGTTVSYPPIMEEEELDKLLQHWQDDFESRHEIDWEDFLRLQGKTEEEWREELRPQAAEHLTQGLALAKLAEQTHVAISDEEIRDEIAGLFGDLVDEEQVSLLGNLDINGAWVHDLRASLLGKKTVEQLERLAQGLPLIEPESESEPAEESLPDQP